MDQAKDHGFKSMAARDLEGVVRALTGIGWDTPIEVWPEDRDISVRYEADVLCRVRLFGMTVMYHLEAESHFETKDGDIAMCRSLIAAMVHDLDVRPVLVLYDPARPARKFELLRKIDRGGAGMWADFKVTKLWEEPPDELLARNRIHLLPMVIAMKSTPEQIREASVRIDMVESDAERRRLHQEMAVFGSIRYTEAEAKELTGRSERSMLPPMELVRETEIGRRIEDIGRFAGKQEGRVEGRAEGLTEGAVRARKASLLQVLAVRFPEITVAESALPSDEDALAALFQVALTSNDRAEVRRALLGEQ